MYEMLIVFIIYLVLSFAGMTAIWTIAFKKGVIAKPWFLRGFDSSLARQNSLRGETSAE